MRLIQDGPRDARIMIVGEAPGGTEIARGIPFCGISGSILNEMLEGIGIQRSEVFVTNICHVRPKGNEFDWFFSPENFEEHYKPGVLQLQADILEINPTLIIALGKFAAQSLLNTTSTIGSLRGKLHDYHGVPVIVTYHPAYLLRTLADKAKAWEDLCFARSSMQALQSAVKPQSSKLLSPE